ncbi:mechanosensitive ion channel [Tamlana sp. 2_MG-2023]|uniref:mechanosensitive ion channel family protein n=1 Tax=unclassified Tamlana TaxID=2614803 RepID=UPI0026E3CDEE|nr:MULTISPECIES: mechanosensitive ion channel [unclassified Tamlana]MDO6760388.1 mechanosensitive ion channel [Tamlana sp. 2_MG-2023]MDO6789913.1 mechanosensitive ion channel [Tamlana sp. 1_MG-2023]
MEEKFKIGEAVNKLWDKLDGWMDAIILRLPNFVLAVLIMFTFYFIARGVRNLLRKFLLGRISQKSIQDIIAKMVFVTVILIGFFIALGVLELNKVLTSILAGAGVVGLAVGLALQGTLSNTVGGLVLSFMPKIRINDYIETSEAKGFVSEISLRSIVLRRPDNNYTIVPNSKFVDNSFTNYSLSKRSRISVSCGVGYESDLQEVEDLVVKVISENFEQQSGESVEFFFTEFGDSSINFMTRFWIDLVKNKEEYEGKHKAIKLIKSQFNEHGINIPFPIRTLDFGKNNLQINREQSEE